MLVKIIPNCVVSFEVRTTISCNSRLISNNFSYANSDHLLNSIGIINATKNFAKILGAQGVVINAVAPGPVETDMLDVIPEERKNAIKSAVYTGRFAKPEEVAKAIVWLATECPEYINGTCVDINNGAYPR